MSVKLVNDATALLSMRESDFDAYSAYGEVIDNSIEAHARNIRIHFDYHDSDKKEYINWVAFGDDGVGMDATTLHHCLQLGYSSRYNSRSGIGRFGVGATLAAINQCQRVEIFSKIVGGPWLHTYVDIEEIVGETPQISAIPEPKVQPPPENLYRLTGEDSGTIVVWKKYDRQPHKATRVIEEATEWVGRTYRYFLWDGVTIQLNNQNVPTIDPLYVRTDLTRFPDDPKAELYAPIKITWPISIFDRGEGDIGESEIEILISLLPEQFRPNVGAGNSNEVKRRFIDKNEGISILRNGREVFYGTIPHWKPSSEEIDRWWGCEIRFNAVLDRAFTVKNIKRGAVPTKELREELQALINPTRTTSLERVRDLWAKNKQLQSQNDSKSDTSTGHEIAERVAKETTTPKNVIDQAKDKDRETRSFVEKWKRDADEIQKAAWRAKFSGQPFTIIEEEWKGPHFFETSHMGGTSVLSYNSRHSFFDELEAIRMMINSSDQHEEVIERLRDIIDLLIMSYAKSEAMFDGELHLSAEDFAEHLRSNWGNYLKSYLRTWRDSRE